MTTSATYMYYICYKFTISYNKTMSAIDMCVQKSVKFSRTRVLQKRNVMADPWNYPWIQYGVNLQLRGQGTGVFRS